MKPDLNIVTHCWSGDAVPIYHKLLCLQLSSLINHPPNRPVQVTVCYTIMDALTRRVWYYFREAFRLQSRQNKIPIYLHACRLDESALFRRAVGRNQVALVSSADVVWFTDVDHYFGDGCLDAAYSQCMKSTTNMVFPRTVNIHKTHELGDELVSTFDDGPQIKRINSGDFYPREEKRAWGGLQIVKGSYCREFGYLNDTKWTQPVDPSQGFRSCKCDVPFRKAVGPSVAVDIPNLYRIRHSRAGRDGGKVDHAEKLREKQRGT